MGRKKIKIQPIKEDRNRSVTYLKRKAGLFKKAHELAVLTDSQVAVIVFGHNGKLAEFCSTDIDLLLLRYTEYEGVAERKGPHNYLNNDKDSDDNDDDNDNEDNDNASGDGPDDDDSTGNRGASSRHAGGRGSSRSGSRSNSRSVSGVKRKAEQSSPPRNTHLSRSTVLAGPPPNFSTAKQTINAAIRQKNHNRSPVNPAPTGHLTGQSVFEPSPFSQSFIPGSSMVDAAMPNTGVMVATPPMAGLYNSINDNDNNNNNNNSNNSSISSSRAGGQGVAGVLPTNQTRAEAIASMSIPMPSNDRLSMFVSPATPCFGLTPGGTVVTPGGRRFSFSDVLTRGSSSSMLPRPVTANPLMPSTFFHNDAFGLAPPTQPHAFNSISPSMSPQPPQGKSVSASISVAARPGIALDTSPTPFPDFRSSTSLLSRPASTGEARSIASTYNQATFAASSGAGFTPSNTVAPAANIVRPFTAAPNLELTSTSSNHLALPGANFQASSASPMPPASSLRINAIGMLPTTFDSNPFVGAGLKSSAATFGGSQTSSATPELISHGNSASAARAPRSSLSTDGETPPVLGGGRGVASMGHGSFDGDHAKLEPDATWLHLAQGIDAKADQTGTAQGTLVQPVPINPTQMLGTVPFDLNFPTRPTQ
ncbi:hypothetical protein EX895_003065 [Sporisorium graminicola]|uniref:MADS-box domain-containing protein n=1 Tax=Sporisorium graminicola TaxID=280036 RepID=A0A4V6YEN9_9BASI|nr:hypothetical protein EX895_003065 [Sporisorium graminicola]TKY87969.1 hypothetical protein EX895_003065 [Sporisorium graminicola]